MHFVRKGIPTHRSVLGKNGPCWLSVLHWVIYINFKKWKYCVLLWENSEKLGNISSKTEIIHIPEKPLIILVYFHWVFFFAFFFDIIELHGLFYLISFFPFLKIFYLEYYTLLPKYSQTLFIMATHWWYSLVHSFGTFIRGSYFLALKRTLPWMSLYIIHHPYFKMISLRWKPVSEITV